MLKSFPGLISFTQRVLYGRSARDAENAPAGETDAIALPAPTRKPGDFVLGNLVKDRITGFEGIAISRTEMVQGVVHIGIQPQVTEGNRTVSGHNFDACSVVYVGEGVADLALTPSPCSVSLGEEVESLVNGMPGIVTDITTHINGCVTVEYVGKVVPGDKMSGLSSTIDHKLLKTIGPGISAKSETPIIPEPTGCPGEPIHLASL